jgi:hypothetical protein
MRTAIVLLAVFLFFPPAPSAQDDYYTKENILKFAEFLYRNGEYERAIGEYLRVTALCQDQKLKDTLRYKIAVADIKIAKPVMARKYCSGIPADTADSLLGAKAACLSAYAYYLEKKYDLSAVFASQTILWVDDGEMKLRLAQIRIGALLKQGLWKDATVEAKKTMELFEKEQGDSLTRKLYAIGTDGMKLHLKNAALAGVMSAIVPGSGKVYADRAGDGLFSFLFVGAMAWQTFIGYKKDGLVSVRCLTFGLFGSAFYGGNIYGSINAAHLYNRSRETALGDRLKLQFDWQ